MGQVALLFVGAILVGLLGCSSGKIPASTAVQVVQVHEAPFELRVIQEANDGSDLYVTVGLKPFVNWQPESVSVLITALRNGEVLYHSRKTLAELGAFGVDNLLVAGREYELVLSTPLNGATDYQLELIWGESGAASPPSIPPSKIALERVVVEERFRCDNEVCLINYVVLGDLVNICSDMVEKVTLGVSFVWVPEGQTLDDMTSNKPQLEDVLQLSELQLAPGASQSFRIRLGDPIPEVPGGRHVPIVRVLEVF